MTAAPAPGSTSTQRANIGAILGSTGCSTYGQLGFVTGSSSDKCAKYNSFQIQSDTENSQLGAQLTFNYVGGFYACGSGKDVGVDVHFVDCRIFTDNFSGVVSSQPYLRSTWVAMYTYWFVDRPALRPVTSCGGGETRLMCIYNLRLIIGCRSGRFGRTSERLQTLPFICTLMPYLQSELYNCSPCNPVHAWMNSQEYTRANPWAAAWVIFIIGQTHLKLSRPCTLLNDASRSEAQVV